MFERAEIREFGSVVQLMRFDDFDPNAFSSVLSEEELDRVAHFKSLSRKREFTATRILFQELFEGEALKYTSNRAPYINNKGYISISHNRHTTVIAHNAEFPIAVDIETIQTKACRLWPKFLSEVETQDLDVSNPLEMSMAWSLKETLYKLAGRPGIIFKDQLQLQRLDDLVFDCRILLDDQAYGVKLATFVREDFVLSINMHACERIE
jgi:4'-phosphopantetheinyl transferase